MYLLTNKKNYVKSNDKSWIESKSCFLLKNVLDNFPTFPSVKPSPNWHSAYIEDKNSGKTFFRITDISAYLC